MFNPIKFLIGFSSIVFRLLSYSFLRWIPAKQPTLAIPVALIAALLDMYFRSSKTLNQSGQGELSIKHTTLSPKEQKDQPPHPHPHCRRKSYLRKGFIPLLTGSKTHFTTINFISTFVNLIFFAAVMDQLWRPIIGMDELELEFVRVGSISESGARIMGRMPPVQLITGEESSSSLLPEGARLVYRLTRPAASKWIVGGDFKGSEETDYMDTIVIDGLYSGTEYEYRILLPTAPHSHHPSFPSTLKFETAPDPSLFIPGSRSSGSSFSFASSSCIIPGFPYQGPTELNSIIGAKYLREEIDRNLGLKFMLFLGDFIYADVPFFAGMSSYAKRYRQVFASPDWQNVISKLPVMSIYDDHEIRNDFSSSTSDEHFGPANEAFQNYLGQGNPPPTPLALSPLSGALQPFLNAFSSPAEPVAPVNYFEYRYADAAFFVLDARAYRSENLLVSEDKTMLGPEQMEVFMEWIARVNETVTWKFIVSSTPMMSLWGYGEEDTWAGFMDERERVLDVLEYVPNVIVLSGDRHEFAAATLRNGSVTEFSTSPLSQFYLPIRTLSAKNNKADDHLLKYIPDGNSKFSVFEVDSRNASSPVVHVRVVIDGEDAWAVDVQGVPLVIPSTGSKLGQLSWSLRELLSFLSRSWF